MFLTLKTRIKKVYVEILLSTFVSIANSTCRIFSVQDCMFCYKIVQHLLIWEYPPWGSTKWKVVEFPSWSTSCSWILAFLWQGTYLYNNFSKSGNCTHFQLIMCWSYPWGEIFCVLISAYLWLMENWSFLLAIIQAIRSPKKCCTLVE